LISDHFNRIAQLESKFKRKVDLSKKEMDEIQAQLDASVKENKGQK